MNSVVWHLAERAWHLLRGFAAHLAWGESHPDASIFLEILVSGRSGTRILKHLHHAAREDS